MIIIYLLFVIIELLLTIDYYYQMSFSYPLDKEILVKHDIVEELLEPFLVDFNSLEIQLNNTKSQLDNAEDLV